MNDSFITALNTQKATNNWMDVIADNMTNVYTPGFREKQVTFKTFLNGAINSEYDKKISQGKSTPGTSNDNLFLEGKGFFLMKTPEGKTVYTRLGEFQFDKDGVFKDGIALTKKTSPGTGNYSIYYNKILVKPTGNDHWSATIETSNNAWIAGFLFGFSGIYERSSGGNVRCVKR